MKPWEETWDVNGVDSLVRVNDRGDTSRIGDVYDGRAQLAAQAPAMARLLGDLQYDRYSACIACGETEMDRCKSDCELVAVLHAAGVRS